MNEQILEQSDTIEEIVDETLIYPTKTELEFIELFKKLPSPGFSGLFKLLQEIYTDTEGKVHIPKKVRGDGLRRIARKASFHYANQLIEIVFSSDNQKITYNKLLNKYQKPRDEISDIFASSFALTFPVRELIRYNPFKEGIGYKTFEAFCRNKIRQSLLYLLMYKNKKTEKNHSTKTRRFLPEKGTRQINYRIKTRSINPLALFRRDSSDLGDSIPQAYILQDIQRFLRIQRIKPKKYR